MRKFYEYSGFETGGGILPKPYFAKYLPVEGEIREGDTFEVEKGTYSKVLSIVKNTVKAVIVYGFQVGREFTCHYVNLQKKFKLFLCSRDIKVGDKEIYITKPDGTELTKVELIDIITDGVISALKVKHETLGKFGTLKQNGFKVIGEISPEAIWVKEGDEFDKNEVDIYFVGTRGDSLKIYQTKVKGPCGHFH